MYCLSGKKDYSAGTTKVWVNSDWSVNYNHCIINNGNLKEAIVEWILEFVPYLTPGAS